MGVAINGARDHPGDDLYLDSVNVNILGVLGGCSTGLKKLMLGELGKVYIGSLFITTTFESTIISQ